MSEKQARASEREGRLCPSSQKERKIGARVGLLRKRCTRHIPWLKNMGCSSCEFFWIKTAALFSALGVDTSKIKTSSCAAMSLVSLFFGAYPVLQFSPPSLPPSSSSSSSSLFVSSEKLFCDKKGALHVFRGDWEGRAKSYDTGTRFLQRARARSRTLSVCRCAARREISPGPQTGQESNSRPQIYVYS